MGLKNIGLLRVRLTKYAAATRYGLFSRFLANLTPCFIEPPRLRAGEIDASRVKAPTFAIRVGMLALPSVSAEALVTCPCHGLKRKLILGMGVAHMYDNFSRTNNSVLHRQVAPQR